MRAPPPPAPSSPPRYRHPAVRRRAPRARARRRPGSRTSARAAPRRCRRSTTPGSSADTKRNPCARPRMDHGAPVEGDRQDGPPVIIGVLAQQVDAAGRRCADARAPCRIPRERVLSRLVAVPVSPFRCACRRKPGAAWLVRAAHDPLLPAAGHAQLAPARHSPRHVPLRDRWLVRLRERALQRRHAREPRRQLHFTGARLGPDPHARGGRPAHRGAASGQPGYKLDLGASVGTAQVSSGTGAFSSASASPRGFRIFGRLPFVSTWWRQAVSIDTATSNAGVNLADPAIGNTAGASIAEVFFTQFNTSLAGLQQRITSGVYDGDPAAKALAIQTLASGLALSDSLSALIADAGTASPFLPLASSSAGPDAERAGDLGAAGPRRPGRGRVLPPRCRCPPTLRRPATSTATRRRASRARSATPPSATASAAGIGDVEVGAVYTVHRPLECRRRARAAARRHRHGPAAHRSGGPADRPVRRVAGRRHAGRRHGRWRSTSAGEPSAPGFSGAYLLQMSGDFTRRVASPLLGHRAAQRHRRRDREPGRPDPDRHRTVSSGWRAHSASWARRCGSTRATTTCSTRPPPTRCPACPPRSWRKEPAPHGSCCRSA